MSLDVMKQALEALEMVTVDVKTTPNAYDASRQAITALRAAIKEAEKPRQWQGLTDEELREAYIAIRGSEWCLGGMSNAESFYEAIETKLREKNR